MKKFIIVLLLGLNFRVSTNAQFNYHLSFETCIGGINTSTNIINNNGTRNSIIIQDSSIYVCSRLIRDTSMHLPFNGLLNDVDIYLRKMNPYGTPIYEKIIGSSSYENYPMLFKKNSSEIDLTFYSFGKDSDITCYFEDTTVSNTINASCHSFSLDYGGNITKKKCFGSNSKNTDFNKCIPTSDGGYLIIGECSYLGGPPNGLNVLIKCDSAMNEIWHYCLDSVGNNDYMALEVENGNYLLKAQPVYSDFFGQPLRGNDVGLVKFSNSGNLLWARSYGSAGVEDFGNLIVDNNSYVFIGGSDIPFALQDTGDVSGHHGFWDIWVVKLDTSGNIIKSKCFGTNLGDRGTNIIAKSTGGYYISGITYSNIIEGDTLFNQGQEDCFIAELDSNLNYVNGICVGGSGRDYVNCIALHPDNSIWGWGFTNSTDGNISFNHGSYDLWLFRLVPDTILSTQEAALVQSDALQLYPNPALEQIRIEFEANALPQRMELRNMQGMLMMQSEAMAQKQNISVAEFPNGVYLLRCVYASGQVLFKKLVVLK